MSTAEQENGSAYTRWFVGAILGIFLGAAFHIPTPGTAISLVIAVVMTLLFWFAGAFGLTGRVAQLVLGTGIGILIAGIITHAQ